MAPPQTQATCEYPMQYIIHLLEANEKSKHGGLLCLTMTENDSNIHTVKNSKNLKNSKGIKMENVISRQRGFELVNVDVTNHCNARCFFCFNDWKNFKPCNMSIEMFQKVLTLLPLMQSKDFLVSCWFEPTINPDFYEMLGLVPAEYKEKVYFTTNLVTAISDSDMEKMCAANVNHINISIETYDPENYVSITGVKKTHFFENLEKLAKYKEKYNMDIHAITMLTERNKEELPSLIKKTYDLLHPSLHEIRTPYYFEEETGTKEKLIDDMLTKKEIDAVRKEVDSFGYCHLHWDTVFTKEHFANMENNRQLHYKTQLEINYRLRVSADGTAKIGHQKRGKLIDLNTVDDLLPFMKKELAFLQIQDAEEWQIKGEKVHIKKGKSDARNVLDTIELYDDQFLALKGWDTEFSDPEKERIIYVEAGNKSKLYRIRNRQRHDVADAFGVPEYVNSGYFAFIDLQGIENKYFKIYTGIKTDKDVTLLHCIFEANKESASLADRIKMKIENRN